MNANNDSDTRDTIPPGGWDDDEPTLNVHVEGAPASQKQLEGQAKMAAGIRQSVFPRVPDTDTREEVIKLDEDKLILSSIVTGRMPWPQAKPELLRIIAERGVENTLGMVLGLFKVDDNLVRRRTHAIVQDIRHRLPNLIDEDGFVGTLEKDLKKNEGDHEQLPVRVRDGVKAINDGLMMGNIEPSKGVEMLATIEELEHIAREPVTDNVRGMTDQSSPALLEAHAAITQNGTHPIEKQSVTGAGDIFRKLDKLYIHIQAAITAYSDRGAHQSNFPNDPVDIKMEPVGVGEFKRPNNFLAAHVSRDPEIAQAFVQAYVEGIQDAGEKLESLNLSVHQHIAELLQHFGVLFQDFDFTQKKVTVKLLRDLQREKDLSKKLDLVYDLISNPAFSDVKGEYVPVLQALYKTLGKCVQAINLVMQVCKKLEDNVKEATADLRI